MADMHFISLSPFGENGPIMPFLAVLFLRVVLYGPQNLVSFKKFPCTDGLG